MSYLKCYEPIDFRNLDTFGLLLSFVFNVVNVCYNIVWWLGAFLANNTQMVVVRCKRMPLDIVCRKEGRRVGVLSGWMFFIRRCRIPSMDHHFGYVAFVISMPCVIGGIPGSSSTVSYLYGLLVAAGALCIRISVSLLASCI